MTVLQVHIGRVGQDEMVCVNVTPIVAFTVGVESVSFVKELTGVGLDEMEAQSERYVRADHLPHYTEETHMVFCALLQGLRHRLKQPAEEFVLVRA